MRRLGQMFRMPRFEDDDDRRAAQLLRLVLWVCLAAIVGYGALNWDLPFSRRWPLFVALATTLLCDWGLRRGYVRPQSWVLVISLTAVSLLSQVSSGGPRAPATLTLFVAVILAGQLLGWVGALFVAAVGSAGVLLLSWLIADGKLISPLLHSEQQYGRAVIVQLLGSGGLMGISAWSLAESLRRLRGEQAAFRDMVEGAPDGIVSLDAEGRVLSVNATHERLTGRPRSELIGKGFDEFAGVEPATLARARELFQALIAGESVPLFRFNLERPDGSSIVVEANARRTQRADGTTGADIVLRDVSEQVLAEQRAHELQEQLRAARKLEAIGQLAGGVAHDFNNLLTVVLGSTGLLRASKLTPEQIQRVEDIEDSGRRAAAITAQLLAIGRRQATQPRALSLNDSLQGLSGILRRMVPANVTMATRLGGDVPKVLVDPAQLEQVALNLVANARDAMPEGGELSIETERASVRTARGSIPPGSYAVLRVRDTGHGMNEETQQRVFEPFFTTKAAHAGTGLGLATVYGIVKQSGGYVTVDSAPGEGSTFSVYLAESNAALEPSPQPRPALGQREAKILLVDDDPQVRYVLTRVLQRAGHQVTAAEGGRQALERASNGARFDVLLTDVVMPELGGIELSHRLRAKDPGLRVLLFSGYSQQQLPSELLDGPGVAYLSKPAGPDLLLERLSELLAR
jgi:two-component system, cell cycle sensor histidine kinase and response regulator CckA